MTKGTLLVAGSNATRIELQGGGSAAIGQYLNETVVPAMTLIEAGYDVVLATPDGTKPHIDEASDSTQRFGGDEAAHERARRFYADDPLMNQVRKLRSVVEDGMDGYASLFVPGGHAPAVDLMQDAELGTILRHFHEARKPTALLCHGPVAIAAAMPRAREFRAALIAGDNAGAAGYARGWAYAGYRMTVFSASEERIPRSTSCTASSTSTCRRRCRPRVAR
ncbi:DJ-1/PfpI family protein [Muricoccus pecuniae]|uniref:Putative intracellular protease/amidase n=1 Tax=Muricoccus pecuniae TaxID=693023 RepID=A0A840YMJ2_9PROT|nr:DJ-1/PfpI family protein [Roseomonas pecuniae]MBB5696253.1 putative intracellular protease/amidase [Roseomonas pecuniae]